MIDRQALEEVAARHFAQMVVPSGVSVILNLMNGEKYTVNGFAEFLDAYCVVRVYPQEPLSAEDFAEIVPKNHEGVLIFDRIMLPYQAIAYVTLTGREREVHSTIGFKVRDR